MINHLIMHRKRIDPKQVSLYDYTGATVAVDDNYIFEDYDMSYDGSNDSIKKLSNNHFMKIRDDYKKQLWAVKKVSTMPLFFDLFQLEDSKEMDLDIIESYDPPSNEPEIILRVTIHQMTDDIRKRFGVSNGWLLNWEKDGYTYYRPFVFRNDIDEFGHIERYNRVLNNLLVS